MPILGSLYESMPRAGPQAALGGQKELSRRGWPGLMEGCPGKREERDGSIIELIALFPTHSPESGHCCVKSKKAHFARSWVVHTRAFAAWRGGKKKSRGYVVFEWRHY